ncbi:hypothetical protein [Streptomyces syringium]|uniref:hypothetical protein n=1 Tax=Streptomyces syringium TaxID=76729 RepID=UPI00345153FE
MTPLKRAAAALATSILLTVGSAVLAAPAHADVDASLLGVIGAESNGTIHLTGPDGSPLLTVPNVLNPVV